MIAFPGHLAATPLGRLVARDRTVIALTYQQTCAALIRRVPAVVDGETAMGERARHLMTALTDTDRALLDAQHIVGSRERTITPIRELLHPVLDRITGQTLQMLALTTSDARRWQPKRLRYRLLSDRRPTRPQEPPHPPTTRDHRPLRQCYRDGVVRYECRH